jgi:outer membrane protein assembly factor BamA
MFKDQVRLETFIDGGGVWEEDENIALDEMRFSAGLVSFMGFTIWPNQCIIC